MAVSLRLVIFWYHCLVNPDTMKRRHFIKATSLSGLILPSLLFAGCEKVSRDESSETTGLPEPFELEELTVETLQEGMASGKYSSRSITQLYLDRISKVDKGEIMLNAVIEINPEAISIAEALDKERKEGKVRGPLHGIPV